MWFVIASALSLLFVLIIIYLKISTGWCKSQKCLIGKTTIITGANTGIGYETALDFAKRGARVILACRDEIRGEQARQKIIEETGNENVIVKIIHMDSFKSVRGFAKEINSIESRLDILVNNAGAAGLEELHTEDDLPLIMQINYFSPVLLTMLLLDLLKKTQSSRVVNLSSIGAKYVRDFTVTDIERLPGPITSYMNSKLCNILFTIELAKKLRGTGVTTYSVHPGAVKTGIFGNLNFGLWALIVIVKNFFFKTTEEGAQTTIYCSVTNGIEKYNGEHFIDCRKVNRYTTAEDPILAQELWNQTLKLINIQEI